MYSLENFSGRDWGFIAHFEVPLTFFVNTGFKWLCLNIYISKASKPARGVHSVPTKWILGGFFPRRQNG